MRGSPSPILPRLLVPPVLLSLIQSNTYFVPSTRKPEQQHPALVSKLSLSSWSLKFLFIFVACSLPFFLPGSCLAAPSSFVPRLCDSLLTPSHSLGSQPHLCCQCHAAAPAKIPERGRCQYQGPRGCRASWDQAAAGRREP